MGNRAVFVLESMPTVGIYVHWNGGPESVLAFIEATKQRKARSPGSDPTYCFARLVQTTADYFNRGTIMTNAELTSVGVGPLDQLDTDNGDNGVYWIADDWSISKRQHCGGNGGPRTPEKLKKEDREKFNGIVEHLLKIDAAREAITD